MRRNISIFVVLIFITALGAIQFGCSRTGKGDSLGFNIDAPKIKERLGNDDGYAFAVMYTGDGHGSLENCGCPSHPMGGLAWGVSYTKAFQHRSSMQVPTLTVDAGNLFTDNRYTEGQLPAEAMVKNQWVLKAYDKFYEAANIGYNDLPYLTEILKKDGYDKRVGDYPFIERLISANIEPTDDAHKTPQPYVIREVTLNRQLPGKKLKIAFVGLTQGKPNNPNNQQDMVYAGYRVNDVFETARRVIPEARQKADLIVVLAYMSPDMVQRLASENPQIDTIIAAKQSSSLSEPEHFGSATVTYAFSQTKYLGEMRYYFHNDGSIETQTNRYVMLDKDIPEDPQAAEMVTAAHAEFTRVQKDEIEATAAPQSVASDAGYVGAMTCIPCHAVAGGTWQKSQHAHAMATLENKNEQFDNDCVRCHVVGFDKGGFQTIAATPQLANVQCESCHGPGRDHVAAPAKGYGHMDTPSGCVQCHTQSNSPDFNFDTYWPQIKH